MNTKIELFSWWNLKQNPSGNNNIGKIIFINKEKDYVTLDNCGISWNVSFNNLNSNYERIK